MVSLIDLTLRNNASTLNTSRNVQPEKPKGYLVETPIYQIPVDYVKDLAKDSYGIIKGFNGKANDHELGKQNDVAMKFGSLAIAAYLLSFRKAKLPKIMELVGCGAFFSSMALWPKLAISLPLKLRTGVDMQQQYVDSYGRKKNFFQDSQYLAWDLYGKDKIKAMGDKMGVPYDVPNRDEVIKEKARKLSVQGNTLWMATAGFATPIMTALICNRLEPAVATIKQKHDLKSTQKALEGQAWFKTASSAQKAAKKAFEEFISSNMGSRIATNKELISKLNWTSTISPLMADNLGKDLDKILSNVKNDITPEYVDKVFETFSEPLTSAGVKKDDLIKVFKDGGLFGKQSQLASKYKSINPKSTAEDLFDVTKSILNGLIDKSAQKEVAEGLKEAIADDKTTNLVSAYNRRILDEKTAGKLRNVFDEMSNYFNRENLLNRWVGARVANDADSMSAYSWQKVTKKIFSAMGMSGKDLETLEKEGYESSKLFEKKLDELVSDPKKYKKAISKIAESIAGFDSETDGNARSQFKTYVDNMCDLSKSALKKLGFNSTAEYIGGRDFIRDKKGNILNLNEALAGSLRNAKKTDYDLRFLGEKASFYRFIQALDFHKRLKDGTLEGQFEVIAKNFNGKSAPDFQRVVEFAKSTMLKAGSRAQVDKLDLKGPVNTYKTVMKLLYGALPEDYVKHSMVDLSTDVLERKSVWEALKQGVEDGYQVAVQSGFDKVQLNRARTGLATETIEALYDASKKLNKGSATKVDLVDNMKKYMQTFIQKVVNFDNGRVKGMDLKKEHDVKGAIEGLASEASPGLKHCLIGKAPVDLVRDAAKEFSNTRKWFKMFGIGGAALLTGTVLATLFFGHLPQKEMYMENGNKKC